jgi:hypothetical protein
MKRRGTIVGKRHHEEIVAGMGALRKRVLRDSVSIREMIKEGCRY